MRCVAYRGSQDELYRAELFPDAAERLLIEDFRCPDLFFLNGVGGKRDPGMLQRQRGGRQRSEDLVRTRKIGAQPESETLIECNRALTPMTLEALDAAAGVGSEVASLAGEQQETAIERAVARVLGASGVAPTALQLQAGTRLVQHVTRQKSEAAALCVKGSALHVETLHARSTQALWSYVVSRTDQLYAAVEPMAPIFSRAVTALAAAEGLSQADVQVAALKDPVSVHEEARNSSLKGGSCEEWFSREDIGPDVPAEACASDMLGATVRCSSTTLLPILQRLQNGFASDVEGEVASLELVRVQNTFGRVRPSRSRYVLSNVRLTYREEAVVCELRLEHAAIEAYDEKHGGTDHCNRLRALMKGWFGKRRRCASSVELMSSAVADAKFEHAFLFLQEAIENPLLLSALIKLFTEPSSHDPSHSLAPRPPTQPQSSFKARRSRLSDGGRLLTSSSASPAHNARSGSRANIVDREASLWLPASRYELFNGATQSAAAPLGCRANSALRLLRAIAAYTLAPSRKRRTFSTLDVAHALRQKDVAAADLAASKGKCDDWALWRSCARDRFLPLVKTLVEGSQTGEGVYQFKHASFQEALAAQAFVNEPVVASHVWGQCYDPLSAHKALAMLLADDYYHHMVLIGGGELGGAFASHALENEWLLDSLLIEGVFLDDSDGNEHNIVSDAKVTTDKGEEAMPLWGTHQQRRNDEERNHSINLPHTSETRSADDVAPAMDPATFKDSSEVEITTVAADEDTVAEPVRSSTRTAAELAAVLTTQERANASQETTVPRDMLARMDDERVVTTNGEASAAPSSRFDDEGGRDLPGMLEHESTAQASNLQAGRAVRQAIELMGQMLVCNEQLTVLSVGSNRLDARDLRALTFGLDANWRLRELRLQTNRIGDEGAAVLSKVLQYNVTLQLIDLSCNGVGPKGAASLADALARSTSLTTLRMSANELGDVGATLIGDALRSNRASALTILDLGRNAIGPTGAAALAAAAQNGVLSQLALHINRLGPEGAAAVGATLLEHGAGNLTRLGLEVNLLGDQGVARLLTHLRDVANCPLSILSLRRNGIGLFGARALAEYAAHPNGQRLAQIDLRFNQFTRQMQALIENAASRRGRALSLILDTNTKTAITSEPFQ